VSKRKAAEAAPQPASLVFTINSKEVDLAKAPHLLQPFRLWTIGQLKGLERAGLSIVGKDPGALSLEELVALVTYVTSQANPQVTGTDVDTLDSAGFGRILGPIMARVTMVAPAEPQTKEGTPALPFPGSSGG
jgi:hypothetical protein